MILLQHYDNIIKTTDKKNTYENNLIDSYLIYNHQMKCLNFNFKCLKMINF
jgi:hypothetical protein